MTLEATDVDGDPYSRGKAHGTACRSKIRAYLSDFFKVLENAGLGDPRMYLAEMLRSTDFVTASRTYAPDLLEEVKGIAAGAEESPELIFALQLMDEEMGYRSRLVSETTMIPKCSSAAVVSSTGETWIGQNLDWLDYTDGHQVLLRIGASEVQPAALVFSVAGILGLMGVNSRGIGVCVNALPQLRSAAEGLPVAFVLRRLLQAHSLADAAEIVRKVPHASGQHYLIAEAGAIRSFEASSDEVIEYHAPDPFRVLHTNHPLAGIQGKVNSNIEDRDNSVLRLQSLTCRLATGNPNLNEIKAALSSFDDPDHPVCLLRGRPSGVFTTGSMISALPRDSQGVTSWVSAGPPDMGYTSFRLP